jgi:hypothetical protein
MAVPEAARSFGSRGTLRSIGGLVAKRYGAECG